MSEDDYPYQRYGAPYGEQPPPSYGYGGYPPPPAARPRRAQRQRHRRARAQPLQRRLLLQRLRRRRRRPGQPVPAFRHGAREGPHAHRRELGGAGGKAS
ncbi:hypothetical protein ACFSTC_02030 [Nonomuraea ferruginea]